jgi:hypothetical protein
MKTMPRIRSSLAHQVFLIWISYLREYISERTNALHEVANTTRGKYGFFWQVTSSNYNVIFGCGALAAGIKFKDDF